MKVLLISLLAFLFFLGCQENSITDPVTIDDGVLTVEELQNLSYKDLISYYPELITIDDRIADPSHPNNLTEVTGFIRYKRQLLEEDKTSPNQIGVKLNFYFNLYLHPECPKNDGFMRVTGISDAAVYFPDDEILLIERHFRVCNCCCCPLDMFFKFAITKNDVQLVSLELKKCPWKPIHQEN